MSYPSDCVRTKNWGTEILTDADLEGQFDLIIAWIMAAMNGSTGHTHTGGSNDAAKITGASISDLTDLPVGAGAIPAVNLVNSVVGMKGFLHATIDGLGVQITSGIKGDMYIPVGMTIDSVTLLADATGDIVVDIWKDTYTNYPATNADSITSATPPTISSSNKAHDATLTTWTKTITAGDTLRFNVDSCTTITRCEVIIAFTRT